jgi:hypothetical protein
MKDKFIVFSKISTYTKFYQNITYCDNLFATFPLFTLNILFDYTNCNYAKNISEAKNKTKNNHLLFHDLGVASNFQSNFNSLYIS